MHTRLEDIGSGYVIVGAILAMAFVVGVVLAWIDRRTEPPIMKTRVNEGSDSYLLDRGSIWHEGLKSARKAHDRMRSEEDDDGAA